MNSRRWTVARLCASVMLAGGVLQFAQQLPNQPQLGFGTSITGAFEGWFTNADGSHSFLVGYYNRNQAEEMDIPIGPNNRIEPGGPDRGQPTHFLTGRQWGMFIVTVPKDFTPQQRLTWTIVANGQPTTIPLTLNTDYEIDPFDEVAVHNTPPALGFEEKGPKTQGPLAMVAKAVTRTVSVSSPLPLTLWATDDAKYTSGSNEVRKNPGPAVKLTWTKFRGPGKVTFDSAQPEMEKLQGEDAAFFGKATTTVRFDQPGEYLVHVTANDYSGVGGGGGFVCCWSTALVKVSVTP